MKIRKTSVLLLILMTSIFASFFIANGMACSNDDDQYTNYAEWRESNGQQYLYVKADNYYTLGFLEGQNLAFQTAFFKLIVMLQAQQLGMPYELAYSYALQYLDFIPEDYLTEMQGMADAIDTVPISLGGVDYLITIDFLDILVQNTFWDFYYGQLLPMLSGFPQPPLIAGLCSAIGSSTNWRPILAQNIDLTYMMVPTTSWVLTHLKNKRIFSFRMGSMLGMGGVNKKGVALSVNLIEVLNVGGIGMPLSCRYRNALEDARTVNQAKDIITSTDNTLGWNYIIKGKWRMTAIETIPNVNDIEMIYRGSYTFDANIYENPLFKMFMMFPSKYIPRYNKVAELCNFFSQDGSLDKNDLISILSYYDGTDSSIFRLFTTGDPWEVGTTGKFIVDSKNNILFWKVSPNLEFGSIRL